MTAYLDAMRRSVDFAGRSTRSQYWLFMLVYFVILLALTILDGVLGTLTEDGIGLFNTLAILAHLFAALSLTVRRLHDIGRSGWWILIGFVPLLGLIVLIVFACQPSQLGSNRFGDQPSAEPVSPTPAPAPAPQAQDNRLPLDQLEKLSALKASGAIDDEEFQAMKAKLLAETGRA